MTKDYDPPKCATCLSTWRRSKTGEGFYEKCPSCREKSQKRMAYRASAIERKYRVREAESYLRSLMRPGEEDTELYLSNPAAPDGEMDYFVCPYCAAHIKKNLWSGPSYADMSLKQHTRACINKTEEEREYFLLYGDWPTSKRKKKNPSDSNSCSSSGSGVLIPRPQLTPQFELDHELWGEVVSKLPLRCPLNLPVKIISIDDAKVYLVDGHKVSQKNPRFWRGGHGYVYPSIIPLDEIWIDGKMKRTLWPFVLYHEVIERRLMAQGWSYEEAHEVAEASEPEDNF